MSQAMTSERIRADTRKELRHRALEQYRPYAKQLEFHNAGLNHRQRLLMAGNQLGKTYAASAETAMHLTGLYPDWWKGRTFDREVVFWTAGETGPATRDNNQRLLLGRMKNPGTGMIPRRLIEGKETKRGIGGAIDTLFVKHKTDGISQIAFLSYEMKREAWQGETLDGVWFDEEPPPEIYEEALTRTNATGGLIYTTFTPLKGMTDVVRQFYKVPISDQHHCTQMTIEDAEHYTEERRKEIIASYPLHVRDARIKGIPMLGSGRVFPVQEAEIAIEPRAIPDHWLCIGGLDFGWDHPTAAVKLYYDPDTDIIYLTQVYREKEKTPAEHAMTLKHWGKIPWAWPHDGLQHDKGSGKTLADHYRKEGLQMLFEHATFEDGGYGVEAGIQALLNRMQTGRFKVFENLTEWWDEFRTYHRKDGKIVKEHEDLMAATRYALMMLRFARRAGGRFSTMKRPQVGWVV